MRVTVSMKSGYPSRPSSSKLRYMAHWVIPATHIET